MKNILLFLFLISSYAGSGQTVIPTFLGPTNTPTDGTGGGIGNGAGRINHFKIDPLNPSNMFASSAHGGMFYSTNSGGTWNGSGTDQLPQMGVSTTEVVHDPSDNTTPLQSNTWFVATGDRDIDGIAQSIGIYRKDVRGGVYTNPWQLIASPATFNGSANDGGFRINKIMADPVNSNVLYAATTKGLYKTCNALFTNTSDKTNGVSWTLINVPNSGAQIANIQDIEFKPNPTLRCTTCTQIQSCILYVSGKGTDGTYGIWQSTDGGVSFPAINLSPTTISTSLMENSGTGCILIEVTPAAASNLYAIVAYPTASGIRAHVYVKVGTGSWIDKGDFFNGTNTATTCGNNSDESPYGMQAAHAYSFCVSPKNADVIAACDIYPVVICTTGTNSSTATWLATGSPKHADGHYLTFDPTGQTLWSENDGGIEKGAYNTTGTLPDPATVSWSYCNSGLGIGTIFSVSSSPVSPYLIGIGEQDDGVNIYNGTNPTNGSWTHVNTGDGQAIRFDNYDVSKYYFMSNSVTYNYDIVSGGLSEIGDCGHAAGKNMIAVNGTPGVVYTLDGRNGFTINRYDLQNGLVDIAHSNPNASFNITSDASRIAYAIYASPKNPNYLYAMVIINTGSGNQQLIYKSTNINDVNTNVQWTNLNNPLPLHFLKDLCVDYDNPDLIYTLYDDFSFYSYDPANGWVSHPKPVDNVTINSDASISPGAASLVKERGTNGGFYAGTTVGVFYTDNTSTKWTYYTGPNVAINDLDINYTVNKLRIGTYGRGTWEADLKCPTVSTLSNNIVPGWNEATVSVTTNQTLQPSSNYVVRAGTFARLNSGFSFHPTGTGSMKVFIHPCNAPGNDFRQGIQDVSQASNVQDNSSMDVSEIQPSIVVYPVPTSGPLTVKINVGKEKVSDLSIYSVEGIKIMSLDGSKIEQTIDLAPEMSNTFIIKLTTDKNVYTKKIVKPTTGSSKRW